MDEDDKRWEILKESGNGKKRESITYNREYMYSEEEGKSQGTRGCRSHKGGKDMDPKNTDN
jgi:hypothetical protein